MKFYHIIEQDVYIFSELEIKEKNSSYKINLKNRRLFPFTYSRLQDMMNRNMTFNRLTLVNGVLLM